MTKIKFTRKRPDPKGFIHIDATEGNEAGRNVKIKELQKGFSKPVDKSKVIPEDSFWKSNAKVVTEAFPFSRTPRFANPESLFECAKEYFIESDNTPYREGKVTEHDKATGVETKEDFIKLKQVYTVISFLNYAGIQTWQWYDIYKKHPAFADVIDFIERTIYDNKFKGAVAGFYNATIITRDLNLVERTASVDKDDDKETKTIDIDNLDDAKLDLLLEILQTHMKIKGEDIIEV